MQLLSMFFPRHSRPRTVVHAGPLLLKRPGGARSLRRYLRMPRKREVFLVHHGQKPLRAIAREAGVTDIAVDTSEREEARVATEMALALGARRLDFTIDEPGVRGPTGDPLREIDASAAESLARDPNIRPRIRVKLRAGCAALREGVARVRIGDPAALARDEATVLLPDAKATSSVGARSPSEDTPAPVPNGERESNPPFALASQAARRRRPILWSLARTPVHGPRHERSRVAAPKETTLDSLEEPWWRLRGGRSARPCQTSAPVT
jgi:hypothetical protein